MKYICDCGEKVSFGDIKHVCGEKVISDKTTSYKDSGFTVKIDFDPKAKLEVEVNGKWTETSPMFFRSWGGGRRVDGKEYKGKVYFLGTDDVSSVSDNLDFTALEELMDKAGRSKAIWRDGDNVIVLTTPKKEDEKITKELISKLGKDIFSEIEKSGLKYKQNVIINTF